MLLLPEHDDRGRRYCEPPRWLIWFALMFVGLILVGSVVTTWLILMIIKAVEWLLS